LSPIPTSEWFFRKLFGQCVMLCSSVDCISYDRTHKLLKATYNFKKSVLYRSVVNDIQTLELVTGRKLLVLNHIRGYSEAEIEEYIHDMSGMGVEEFLTMYDASKVQSSRFTRIIDAAFGAVKLRKHLRDVLVKAIRQHVAVDKKEVATETDSKESNVVNIQSTERISTKQFLDVLEFVSRRFNQKLPKQWHKLVDKLEGMEDYAL
jgi:hypothetical protein